MKLILGMIVFAQASLLAVELPPDYADMLAMLKGAIPEYREPKWIEIGVLLKATIPGKYQFRTLSDAEANDLGLNAITTIEFATNGECIWDGNKAFKLHWKIVGDLIEIRDESRLIRSYVGNTESGLVIVSADTLNLHLWKSK